MTIALVLMNAKSRFLAREVIASEVKILARYFAEAPVVLMSVSDDDTNLFAAIAAGARGVVPATVSLKIVVAALWLVMAGGTYWSAPLEVL